MPYFIKISFQRGIFPDALKAAKVTSILKKGDPQLPSNYCPISVLSVFIKLLEKCMYSRLHSFITKKQYTV